MLSPWLHETSESRAVSPTTFRSWTFGPRTSTKRTVKSPTTQRTSRMTTDQHPAWLASDEVAMTDRHGTPSNEAGIAQILLLILVVLAIVALTIWIVQQLT